MLYPYKCLSGHVFTLSRQVANRDDEAVCPECGLGAYRVFGEQAKTQITVVPQRFHTNNSDIAAPGMTLKEMVKTGEWEPMGR